jgi:hypothetical protein
VPLYESIATVIPPPMTTKEPIANNHHENSERSRSSKQQRTARSRDKKPDVCCSKQGCNPAYVPAEMFCILLLCKQTVSDACCHSQAPHTIHGKCCGLFTFSDPLCCFYFPESIRSLAILSTTIHFAACRYKRPKSPKSLLRNFNIVIQLTRPLTAILKCQNMFLSVLSIMYLRSCALYHDLGHAEVAPHYQPDNSTA